MQPRNAQRMRGVTRMVLLLGFYIIYNLAHQLKANFIKLLKHIYKPYGSNKMEYEVMAKPSREAIKFSFKNAQLTQRKPRKKKQE